MTEDTQIYLLTTLNTVEALLPVMREHLAHLEVDYKCKQIQRMVMDCDAMIEELKDLKDNGPHEAYAPVQYVESADEYDVWLDKEVEEGCGVTNRDVEMTSGWED